MDDSTILLLAGLSGLLCLAAVFLLGLVVVVWTRRQKDAGVSQQRAPVSAAPAARSAPGPSFSMPASNLPANQVEEDELPTVVVAQPPPQAPAHAPPSTPSRRSAGATIIAFDDEEEEDE